MSSFDNDTTQPRRAATDSQVTYAGREAWSWNDLFGRDFAGEVMEDPGSPKEQIFEEERLFGTPDQLDSEDDGGPRSIASEARRAMRTRPATSRPEMHNVRVFHSKNFGTNATADNTRPAWWSQWVETCRQQKSKLLDELLSVSNVTAASEGAASADAEALEKDLKQAFKQSKLWQALVPSLHHHYSQLYTQLIGDQKEQEPSSSLDLRTTGPINVHTGLNGPIMIDFHLEAHLKAETKGAAAEEGDELQGSPTIKTEFFGVKNGHNDGWKWEISEV